MVKDMNMIANPVPRATTLAVDGERISYVTAGEGTAILLLHGWPQTAHAWRSVLPDLARHHCVVAPDLPGMGRSSKARQSFAKVEIADVMARFMASLGHDRFIVVGHDMGGQVAYPLAARHRDAVTGLVFVESGLPGFGQERAMDVARGGSWHFGFNMAGDISGALVSGKEEVFLDFVLLRDRIGVQSQDAVTDADIAVYARAMRRPGALRCMFGYYRALLDDLEDNRRLGETPLDCPVLAVSADQGYVGGAERTMRQVAMRVTSCTIADSGHYLPEEQPIALAQAIHDFAVAQIAATC